MAEQLNEEQKRAQAQEKLQKAASDAQANANKSVSPDTPKSAYQKVNKVKNITKRDVPLASGIVGPGETGNATAAECSTLSKYIEMVD